MAAYGPVVTHERSNGKHPPKVGVDLGRVAAPVDTIEWVNSPEPEYDWLVPGLLETMDRLILTGGEGDGKSTLCRQFGCQVACGIHPFTLEECKPRNVLVVDLENPRRHLKRELTKLFDVGFPQPGRLWLEHRPEGCDLGTLVDQMWLEDAIKASQAELLVIGPLYKLADGDPTEEKIAKPVAVALDKIRVTSGCAVILEAHTPHPATAGGKRPTRPYGASLWLRWPEFGLHLSKEGLLTHWRGARDERAWPALLARGYDDTWPWVTPPDGNPKFAALVTAVVNAGRELSSRELAETTGIARTTVQRAIEANATQWAQVLSHLGEVAQGGPF